MKTIVLIRHAKSDKKTKKKIRDIERPLNKRGMRDAPVMGKVLRNLITPELILTSPATRALRTAQIIASEYHINGNTIQSNPELYLESKSTLLKAIRQLNNTYNTVFIVGHNPGLTDLINYLSLETIDNLPTSGAFAISFDTDSWDNIDTGSGKLLFYEYPKKHRKDEEQEEESENHVET
jgi:phosphohistidine phosphatase